MIEMVLLAMMKLLLDNTDQEENTNNQYGFRLGMDGIDMEMSLLRLR